MRDLWRLLCLPGPSAGRQALGILLGVVVSLSNVALLALSGWFIAAMGLAGLGLIRIEYFLPAAAIRALAIIRTIGRYLERLTTHDATFRMLSGLRVWFYEKLEPLAPAGLQSQRTGDLLSRLRADIDSLDNFYLRVLAPSLVALISAALIFAALCWWSTAAALADLTGLIAVGLGLPALTFRLGRQDGAESVAERGALRADLADTVRGIEELLVFGAVEHQFARHRAAYGRLGRLEARQARQAAGAAGTTTVLIQLTMLAAFAIILPLSTARAWPAADLPMILLLVLASFDVVSGQPAAYLALGETLAAARRVFEIADQPPAVPEPETPAAPPTRFDLRFRQVSFRYHPDAPWALQSVSFDLRQGAVLGVIGPTGSGKSSLINLILRFWLYDAGEITLGGVPINHLPGAVIRGLCGVITQQTHLFNTSIRENLRIAKPMATEVEMRAALEAAGLGAEVDALPDGLATMVGELGTALSGGQARRIAIARVFLQDAPLLLLDEPTEGLDPIAEQHVTAALQRLMAGRTTLLITHRPQALRGIPHQRAIIEGGHLRHLGHHGGLVTDEAE